MYDMKQIAIHPQRALTDPLGVMSELDHWSPKTAHQLAASEGLFLDEEHWAFLYCLRERYRECGPNWSARALARTLRHDYAAQGGSRYLFTLFPGGPIAQGCRIAGLPVPHDAVDPSFGSVH